MINLKMSDRDLDYAIATKVMQKRFIDIPFIPSEVHPDSNTVFSDTAFDIWHATYKNGSRRNISRIPYYSLAISEARRVVALMGDLNLGISYVSALEACICLRLAADTHKTGKVMLCGPFELLMATPRDLMLAVLSLLDHYPDYKVRLDALCSTDRN